jgi:hypothetical protein
MSAELYPTLQTWIQALAQSLAEDQAPNVEGGISFLRDDQLIFELIDQIAGLPDEPTEAIQHEYSAYFLAFDICVAQIQSAAEHQNKHATRLLKQLMDYLAQAMRAQSHTLGFWLPILNAFYETHIELADALQLAYLDLAEGEEEFAVQPTEAEHFHSLKEMLNEMADMSSFDIAEQFFSQSHAMPVDFYIDLVFDLCSINEGHDVAILFLLHPKLEVRSVVISVLDQVMDSLTLSASSLSHLKAIKRWYPESDVPVFERWIKIQRKKGGVYLLPTAQLQSAKCLATEIDGAGSQGVFIQLHGHRKYRICGLLFKMFLGIKEVWITTDLSKKEVVQYTHEAFDERMSLREVEPKYVQKMVNHFLAMMQKKNEVPPLHLLEIQSLLGLEFYPEEIDVTMALQELGIQINPFTAELVEDGVNHSRTWFRDKVFTQSWFEEGSAIDTYVNQCCSFVKGVKVCTLDKACELIMNEALEPKRDKWIFHFLWTALWAKSKSRKRERFWQDCFFVAYALSEGRAFNHIPVLNDIANLIVLNSLETMGERRSHLNLSK